MLRNQRIVVVLPAYNAELTLARTVGELDRNLVDSIVLVDDASTDHTLAVARRLGLETRSHPANMGYGGNQKTCYRAALELGADIVVMVHPDYQYSPRLVPAMASMVAYGEYDLVLGSRMLAQNPHTGGMPLYKQISNRVLTRIENRLLDQRLSEYHTGLRAYSRALLEQLPWANNSDDFVFDNQMLVQAIASGARIGELSCPTRYNPDASSIDFKASVRYGLGVLGTALSYQVFKHGFARPAFLDGVRQLPAPEPTLPLSRESLQAQPVDGNVRAGART